MPADLQNMTFYHGTRTTDAAKSIMISGIVPPDINGRKNWLTPIQGAVYVTPNIEYATIYALGGDFMGHAPPPRDLEKDIFGYVFEIPASQLGTVQPDEDSIGEMIHEKKAPPWLKRMFTNEVSQSWQKKLMWGDYVMFARVGKMMLRRMNDAQKIEIITLGAHVANFGTLHPTKCWRIDKRRSKEINPDASNFFEVAEDIT